MNTRPRKSRFVSVFSRGFVPALVLWAAGSAWSAPASGATKPAFDSNKEVVLVPIVGAAKDELLRALAGKAGDQGLGTMHHECPGGTPHVQAIACGGTVSDSLTQAGSCPLSDGSYVDFYGFNGTAGQQVTINMSAAYDTFLFLLDPAATVVATDDDGGGGTNSRIVFTLTSSGSWFIAANSFAANTFGAYNLSLVCSGGGGGGGCVANATTLCLNNNRFRVTATFATNAGQSGNGMAVPETSDTGMFWFFSANNIEMILKVVNGCALNSRYWVFAGGLTNVAVTITVTDTLNGTTRTYSNPQNTAFAPIQDTSAFATCP
ncbi:MAG: PPC domain-containing protein [Acidobacteriota bacterium]